MFPNCVNFGSVVIYVQHVRKFYKKYMHPFNLLLRWDKRSATEYVCL
jgi:hypothetical protein